jgi:hypothetical protein
MRERGDEELPSLTPSLLDMPLPLHSDRGSQEARIRGPSSEKIKYLSCENSIHVQGCMIYLLMSLFYLCRECAVSIIPQARKKISLSVVID